MHIVSRKTLKSFYEGSDYCDAKGPLESWFHEVCNEEWKTPSDVKVKYRSASFLKDNRIVFNIGGNKYRLVVKVNYSLKIVFIRFVGAHAEYDKIDAEVV
ncbi:MAG: type II toxin-antitoxin system HigB family toxin [Syntrophobacterales bacterium]|nr:type II toxin-antitoxin system HigB family toxin [Syntrophobacterales bacterium]